ncbi:MAG: penicillin-binding protein activator LpoB [Flammeovirgaceae bacterium]|nr:penicillin-binding protein activator LpoB [Flammeovirgaceae bacterium]
MTRLLLLSLMLFSSCNYRSVSRISPNDRVDLSGRWNDADSDMVAEKMIEQLVTSQQFLDYARKSQDKPVIITGMIYNKTSEHIDANNFVKKIEYAIFQSGVADLVESGEFRDKLRVERVNQSDFSSATTISKWGDETGADLMLFGEMTSETDVYRKDRVVNYVTTLFLTDMETNTRVWYGQHEIKKYIRN